MSIILCSANQGSEYTFAQQAVDWLEASFPGWEWTACVDGGILYIKNSSLSERWGMQKSVFRVDKAWIIRAGGELLERFGMSYDGRKARLSEAKRDFTGGIVSEKWTPDRRFYKKAERRWKA